ncbi:UNVERIFIED_CONTAM: hypothetical protein K2H54_013838 [Gekko kuhli]
MALPKVIQQLQVEAWGTKPSSPRLESAHLTTTPNWLSVQNVLLTSAPDSKATKSIFIRPKKSWWILNIMKGFQLFLVTHVYLSEESGLIIFFLRMESLHY